MRRAPTAPPSHRTRTAATNPFPGPQAYDREDQQYFFGREDEIEELTSLVLTSSATLVYAPSGAGKSSLLRAGLCPALERDFDVLVLPTVHFGTVARADSTGGAPNSFVRTVCETIAGAGGAVGTPMDIGALAARERGESSRRVLLVLDQFEEVFNDPALWQQREQFFRALTAALDTHPWLRAVIALRSDYLADLVPYQRMLPGRLAVRYQLENLTEEQAAEAIRSAFEASGVALAEQDLTRLLDLLLEDTSVPHLRAPYVNTLQLQIVCRRLWQQVVEQGAAGRTALDAGFSVRESMVQFVDGAIGSAVSATRGDEAQTRWWLETQLVTSADRRAFVLVEGTHAAGLPIHVVEALVAARLLQVEQRHGSRLVELPHDSMVGALQASNESWRRDRGRRRRRVTLALSIALALLVAAFPWLQVSGVQPQRYSGWLTDPPSDAQFEGDGTMDVVFVDLYAAIPVEVAILERRGEGSAEGTVASRVVRTQETGVAIPVDTQPGYDYRVRLAPQGPVSADDYISLSITDLPVAEDRGRGSAQVSTAAFGIPLDPGTRTVLTFPENTFTGVGGVDVLAHDLGHGWAVVEPTDASTLAVVSRVDSYSSTPASPVVKWGPLEQPQEIRLAEQVTVRGQTPAFRSFTTELPDPGLGAKASCSEPVQMYRLGAGTASAWGADPPMIERDRSAVLPLNVGTGRHVIVLASPYGGSVDCMLIIRPFGSRTLSGFGAHDLLIDDDVGTGVYAMALPEDGVLVAEPRAGVVLTTVCRDAAPETNTLSSQRILIYLPRDGECAVWASSVDPAPGSSQRIWLAPAGPDGGE